MKFLTFSCALFLLVTIVSSFWDVGTTTEGVVSADTTPRQSFFRWQWTESNWVGFFYWGIDWDAVYFNRRLCSVAGISIDLLCITTGALLNRRTVLTSANALDPYFNRQRDLRIWALGARGLHKTPYRYRAWRVTRLFPKSLNPEHWHGPRGVHSPRHDVALIHSLDQIYLQRYVSTRGHYPYRSLIIGKHVPLPEDTWISGSGYENREHIKENYKIYIHKVFKKNIVDCSKYLPKYWGKFICMTNVNNFPGIQNGGGFHSQIGGEDYITALGCFEIRYNEDRILAFTDLRYYYDWIFLFADLKPGDYYEYAYPAYGISHGWLWDSGFSNYPVIPAWQIQDDFYPLGRK